ncbi:MAG: DUF2190 family protein, partial [Bacteroidetes bacterium]|nr:DUF2190 family protein [Bacteroidota bacterium]
MAVTDLVAVPKAVDNIEITADIDAGTLIGYDGAVCAAGAQCVGVTMYDHESGEMAACLRGKVPVVLGATVAAGARIESDASGLAITLASGVALGF